MHAYFLIARLGTHNYYWHDFQIDLMSSGLTYYCQTTFTFKVDWCVYFRYPLREHFH